jgi:predicted phosphodiesterase
MLSLALPLLLFCACPNPGERIVYRSDNTSYPYFGGCGSRDSDCGECSGDHACHCNTTAHCCQPGEPTPEAPYPAPAPEAEVFFYLGDPQIGFGSKGWHEDVQRFSAVADIANESNCTAVVIAGDLVNVWDNATLTGGFDDVWPTHFKKNNVHLVPGNHDVNSESKTAQDFMGQLSHYRAAFGTNYHSFSTRYAEFFLIDSESLIVPYLGLNGTTNQQILNETQTQWHWLENTLAQSSATHKIIVSHHPPFLTTETEAHQYFNYPVVPRKQLMALARKYEVKNLLCGHTHTTTNRSTADGISIYTVAGTARAFDKNGCGYMSLAINQTSIVPEYHRLTGPLADCSPHSHEIRAQQQCSQEHAPFSSCFSR